MDQAPEEEASALADLLGILPGFGFRCRQDESLSALWISAGVKAVTGYSASAFLQDDMSLGELLLPQDRALLAGDAPGFDCRCRIRSRRDGLRTLWLHGRRLSSEAGPRLEGWALELGAAPAGAELSAASHALLDSLLDSLPDAVYYTDLEGRILGCNQAFALLLGLPQAEIPGRLSSELAAERHEAHLHELAEVTAGGEIRTEIEFTPPGGEPMRLELIKRPYRKGDRIIGLIAIGRDITSRHRQATALERSVAEFRQLIEGMSVPVLVARQDARGGLLYLNAAFLATFGWEVEDIPDLASWGARAFPDPAYRESVLAEIAPEMAALNPAQPRSAARALWISGKDGGRRLAEAIATLVGDRIIITYHDITDLKQAEDALRESETRTRQILDAVPAGIFVVDHRGQPAYANRRARQLTRRKFRLSDPAFRPEMAGQTYFTPAGEPYPFEQLPLVRALQGEAAEADDISLWNDEDAIPLEIKASPIRDERGRISHAVAVFDDISERQRRERELIEAREKAESASRAKGEFLANMSHEIRTPLHAISGLNQLLLRTALDARQLDYVRSNQQAAQNLLGIINDILDVSKIEAGMLHLERTGFELNSVLANLFNLLGLRAQEKGLELVVRIGDDLPAQLVGDPLRLEQVLVNLVGNAIKFTPAGEVSLSVSLREQDKDSVRLDFEVCDTGIGISEAEGAKLFQAFSQADGSTTRTYGGTGLGLAISRVLVELMGGRIGFTSTPGQGSCFRFDIRLGRRSEALAAPRQLPADLSEKRVLVIDDHQVVLEVLGDYLRRFGIQADTWLALPENLPELQDLSASPYDLLLVDWRMPGLDFARLLAPFRASQPAPSLVLMTAAAPDELAQAAPAGEFARVLHKPITPSQLYDLFSELFGSSGAGPANLRETRDAYFKGLLAPLAGTRLLLVEDHPVNQRVARELLEGYGFVVGIAANGSEALSMLEAAPDGDYALVLMDLQMPVMDGFEATRRIRAQARFRELPILAMTADAIEGVKAQVLATGMNDYITKPIDLELLLGMLHRWLSQRPAPAPAALPGIELKSALRRVGGNRVLYLELLRECARLMQSQRAGLAAALGADDAPPALQLSHAMRGAAANLGLKDIASSLQALEAALKAGNETRELWQAVEAALDGFDALLPQLDADKLGAP